MDHERIEQLEERVRQLEEKVAMLTHSGSVRPKVKRQVQPRVKEQEKQERKPVDWENVLGRVWLPRIFIFVLLLGVIWGFKVAVDYGLLTESVRIIIGFTAAIALYLFGDLQIRKERGSLGKSLLAGSVGMLVLTTFAMNVLYGMIPSSVGFILNLVWVALGLFLAHRHRSEVLAILFALIGYLIPFLVVSTGNVFGAVIYELILYGSLVFYAIQLHFKRLFYTAAILLHAVYSVFWIYGFISSYNSLDDAVTYAIVIGVIVQHLLILYAAVWAKLKRLFPIPLIFTSFVVTAVWVKIGVSSPLYTSYLIAMLLLYFGLYILRKRSKEITAVSLAILTFALFLLTVHLFGDQPNLTLALLLVEGLLALYLGLRFRATFQMGLGSFVYLIGALGVISKVMTEQMISIESFMWILFIVTLYGLIYLMKKFYAENRELHLVIASVALFGHLLFYNQIPAYVSLVSLQFIVTLCIVLSFGYIYYWTRSMYRGIKAVDLIIGVITVAFHMRFITDAVTGVTADLSNDLATMIVSFAWALYAVLCVIVGLLYHKKAIRLAGIFVLMFTLVKVVFVDLQYVTIIIRAILFIVVGIIGIVLSRMLYTKK